MLPTGRDNIWQQELRYARLQEAQAWRDARQARTTPSRLMRLHAAGMRSLGEMLEVAGQNLQHRYASRLPIEKLPAAMEPGR